jgi:FkbM family methyltransferase
VIDVGGLLGDFSLQAAKAGCRAMCFEPQPAFADLIRASTILNRLEEKVHVVNAAIGGKDNQMLYYTIDSHGGNAGFSLEPPANQEDDTFQIKSYRLDELLKDTKEKVLLIKIDVEGYDVSAVYSAKTLLANGRVKHLIFEYTAFLTGKGQGRWLEVLYWLNSLAKSPRVYALHHTGTDCYGPLLDKDLYSFHKCHMERLLQTDIYATWDDDFDPMCSSVWYEGVYA